MTKNRSRKPAPMTPADANLQGNEPPWGAFVEMAISQFGVTCEQAEAYVEAVKAAHRKLH